MGTKPTPKKKTTKSASSACAVQSETASSSSSSIIPFGPIAAETFKNFQSAESPFNTNFANMENIMAYKDQYEKISGDAGAAMRQSIESCVKSSTQLAKGAEQMIKTIMETAQASSARNAEAIKSLMASRTINEFAEAQNKLMQQNFDEAMSAATKLSEMAIKISTEALEPVNAQMTKAMKKASESMAA